MLSLERLQNEDLRNVKGFSVSGPGLALLKEGDPKELDPWAGPTYESNPVGSPACVPKWGSWLIDTHLVCGMENEVVRRVGYHIAFAGRVERA